MSSQKPKWREEKHHEALSIDVLENFAHQLHSGKTLLHIQNDDPYNILNDKIVHLHKQPERKSSWLEDLKSVKVNAHERRFDPLPFDGLPEVHSKVRRAKQPVDIDRNIGRHLPIVHLVSNEVVQLKKPKNTDFYDFDLEKSTMSSLAKQCSFPQESRFTNKGIFGDIFDQGKTSRFGRPKESSVDPNQVDLAKD
mmetsp:Transcript_22959/g.35409  ORF Transcript_22959/g.35409 Transcript_22959/m.35409 type:complete len:195 (-) Transcript_22959:268-852(-)